MFIGLVSTCGDYGLANVLFVIQRIMALLQFTVPFVAIIALVRIFRKKMMNPDDSKLKGRVKNWILAIVMIFLLPTFVDIAISNADMALNDSSESDFTVSACWRAAKEHSSLIDTEDDDDGYIETNQDKDRKHLVD